MLPAQMKLKILLPSKVFLEKKDVLRIVAEGNLASFGLLPHRLDCVATLVPGILTYESQQGGECFIAIDEGVLVKTGLDVNISVRNAIAGKGLGQLREAVAQEYLIFDEEQRRVQTAMEKMESSFIQRLAEMRIE